MKNFFWNGATNQEKITLLSWEKNCMAKGKGGARMRDCNSMNEALGEKLVCNIYAQPSQLWVHILKVKYLNLMENSRIFTMRNPPSGLAI